MFIYEKDDFTETTININIQIKNVVLFILIFILGNKYFFLILSLLLILSPPLFNYMNVYSLLF